VFSLAGTSTFTATVKAHALGSDVNLIGSLNLQASTDGVSYTTVGTFSVNLPEPLTHTYDFSVISTGSYQYARIDWEVEAGSHDDGFFDTGSWTTTVSQQYMEQLGGAPWWFEFGQPPQVNLQIVDTIPGAPYYTGPVIPGAKVQFAIKTSVPGHAIELGTLLASLGYSRVMNSGLLPDVDPNLAALGAMVQYQTTELRLPVNAVEPVTQSAPGILFSKTDDSDFDKSIYAVQFPIQTDASILGYFKFQVQPSWTLFDPDWVNETNMTGMYFGLEHGSFNTACYFFLRNDVTGGSAIIGGPLPAFDAARPGQQELTGFKWSTLPEGTDVEVWIYFNTLGYPPPFGDPYVPVVEIWTQRSGVDAEPIVQAIFAVGDLGQFDPLSADFPNVRAGPSGFATMYFGNAGRTGDLLQLDDWTFFPDYRVLVNAGQAMPTADLFVEPDCLVSYAATDKVFPDGEIPAAWFPMPDSGFLRPNVDFYYQPSNSITPYALEMTNVLQLGSGYYKTEPRLQNGDEGAMIESFFYGNETVRAVDSFGAGISIEDGSKMYRALLIQTPTTYTVGLLSSFSDQSINGYFYPVEDGQPLAIDWTTPHLVRLCLDKLREKVSIFIDEVLVLEVSTSAVFPPSNVDFGRMSFGFLYPNLLSTGTANFVSVNYSPRYKAYEVSDVLLPQNVSWMSWDLEKNDSGGTDLFNNDQLSGIVSFTHGSPNVTGTDTSFNTQVVAGQYVKLASDPDTDYALVETVVSNTQLTLAANYGGTTSAGTGLLTDPDFIVITKAQYGAINTYNFYSREDDFGEDKGFYVDFGLEIFNYTDASGRAFAPSIWTGVALTVYLGNKILQLAFVDGGTNGRFMGIIPGSGTVNDIIDQTPLGQAFSAQVNWTDETVYRIVLKGFNSIEVWAATTVQQPLITIPWQNDVDGFDLPLNSTPPAIQFGHFDYQSSSSSGWAYIRYGIGDGYELAMDQQFPNGIQPYAFSGKVFERITFDQS
jgi:hypothetical protein